MATKVAKAGVKREKGWLYFLDKNGNVARAKMVKGGGKHGKQRQEVLARTGVKRQQGYLYFIDKQGDVAMAKMNRGGKRKRR
jgi:hypothetical protein